jgi:hypothetical protein
MVPHQVCLGRDCNLAHKPGSVTSGRSWRFTRHLTGTAPMWCSARGQTSALSTRTDLKITARGETDWNKLKAISRPRWQNPYLVSGASEDLFTMRNLMSTRQADSECCHANPPVLCMGLPALPRSEGGWKLLIKPTRETTRHTKRNGAFAGG